MHSNNSGHTEEQDLLSHLLRNLAGLAGSINGRNIDSLFEGSQSLLNAGTSNGALPKVPNVISNGSQPTKPSDSACKMDNGLILLDPPKSVGQHVRIPASDVIQKCTPSGDAGFGNLQSPSGPLTTNALNLPSHLVAVDNAVLRTNLNNIDLNNVYDDTQEAVEIRRKSHALVPSGIGPLDNCLRVQSDSLKSRLPHTRGNSDSTSSSSSREAQNRTDRIVFKLFGKEPNDLPLALRSQVLGWLSHHPTDIESYIRPGCIVLTLYLCVEKSTWEELCSGLGSRLKRLLNASNDSFWRTGWVYARVRHRAAFVCNGQVVLDVPLPWRSSQSCKILSIKPIAVSASTRAQFVVKGYNLSHSSTKLLCALEGKYLLQESCYDLREGAATALEQEELQCLSFSCCTPNVTGRGFIEIEDHGLSSCFFPFIVADQEMCSEISLLEGVIEAAESADVVQRESSRKLEEKTRALEFIHEMGWLLHRSHVEYRLGPKSPNHDCFPFKRFKWLVEFSMDHDWCSVVKKLLGILFEGTVDAGEHPSIELALLDMYLLHRAVKRNCRPMVELLLRFVPVQILDKTDGDEKQLVDPYGRFFFKPNVVGPAGLTPLHVAASKSGFENVLDALTNDPGSVGIEAWESARDSTGLTPNDYACLQGHYSYVHLVQKKISKKSESQHLVLDIPGSIIDCNNKQKQFDGNKSSKVASLQSEKIEMKTVASSCELCEHKLAYGNMRTSLVYRPAMLSMVAVAAVCVCVALLFKSSPKVLYVLHPFTWESLKYGPV
ncbi:Squamosa promoter-binding-like protein [Quillaja saponaria]|uniref:Squamosa promoter-binding-like protein n=1 Tax=Quillaja saponaria TaxID=32244 RepID=A0AAD7VLK8_QUISA|nr:Squamosa promoter-binding-like protein [Quillaja saponaria]